jgi:hypothetical protein
MVLALQGMGSGCVNFPSQPESGTFYSALEATNYDIHGSP